MSEVFSFRVARSPQRTNSNAKLQVPLFRSQVKNENNTNEIVIVSESSFAKSLRDTEKGRASKKLLSSKTSALSRKDFDFPILAIDKALSGARESLKLDEFDTLLESFRLKKNAADIEPHFTGSASKEYWATRTLFADSFLASLHADTSVIDRDYLNRTMHVFGLIEAFVIDRSSFIEPIDLTKRLFDMYVILPIWLFPSRPILARRTGFSDHYLVRDEWIRYVAGEIAHIENILGGELKLRTIEKVTEKEETTTIDTTKTDSEQRDLQTTDRFELNSESSKDVALAVRVEAQVDTSGQYGPTKVDTHLGGSLDYSTKESNRTATTQSKETVARAISKIEQKVRNIQTVRSLVRTTEKDEHKVENTLPEPVAGVYRWVEKIQRYQLFRYPHRFLLEFQLPEPAQFISWLNKTAEPTETLAIKPPEFIIRKKYGLIHKFIPLEAGDITSDNYMELASKFGANRVPSPPQSSVVLSVKVEVLPEKIEGDDLAPLDFKSEDKVAVPDGYIAKTWIASFMVHKMLKWPANVEAAVTVAVGGSKPIKSTGSVNAFAPHSGEILDGKVGNISTGTLPVLVMATVTHGLEVGVDITCEITSERLNDWRMSVFERIAAAHAAADRVYREEVLALKARKPFEVQGPPPGRAKEIIREELKRQIIEMLLANNFRGYDLVKRQPPDMPATKLQEAADIAPVIQFLEQAFEWTNMSYIFYPYYWATSSQWRDLAQIEHVNDEYAQFLRSGSARVILPARPQLAAQVQMFTETGIMWGGTRPPGPEEEEYISVAQEIMDMTEGSDKGDPLDSWEHALPTTLLWVENAKPLPENLNTKLTPPKVTP